MASWIVSGWDVNLEKTAGANAKQQALPLVFLSGPVLNEFDASSRWP